MPNATGKRSHHKQQPGPGVGAAGAPSAGGEPDERGEPPAAVSGSDPGAGLGSSDPSDRNPDGGSESDEREAGGGAPEFTQPELSPGAKAKRGRPAKDTGQAQPPPDFETVNVRGNPPPPGSSPRPVAGKKDAAISGIMLLGLLETMAVASAGPGAALTKEERELIEPPLMRILARLDAATGKAIQAYADPMALVIGLFGYGSRVLSVRAASRKATPPVVRLNQEPTLERVAPLTRKPVDDDRIASELDPVPSSIADAVGGGSRNGAIYVAAVES